MTSAESGSAPIDFQVRRLFALVSEALGHATSALLDNDPQLAQSVIDGDQEVDELTAAIELLVWEELQGTRAAGEQLRHLVSLLLIIPELERSADLAEHIAQRAVSGLGADMSPRSRGIIQLMTEVAIEMWQSAADAFADRSQVSARLAETDEEMDDLHERLTTEIAAEGMPVAIAAQVTLLARFYERLGDHAVNLARRIEALDGGVR
jgi:phosphate transport system protein